VRDEGAVGWDCEELGVGEIGGCGRGGGSDGRGGVGGADGTVGVIVLRLLLRGVWWRRGLGRWDL